MESTSLGVRMYEAALVSGYWNRLLVLILLFTNLVLRFCFHLDIIAKQNEEGAKKKQSLEIAVYIISSVLLLLLLLIKNLNYVK